MDKAKAAVSSLLSEDGKHDTTVHESINPAVTNENVIRTEHENAQKVVDREIHQDHHHTSVQPILDKEVLPEQHKHNLVGTEHREFNHGDNSHVKQRLENEAAQFRDTREVSDTKHTSSASPALEGEHVHHHVHENIQPVIQKETVQPSVVHTTVPVHEVHHNETKHHTASSLPAVTRDEFERQGGPLSGREVRTDAFAGEPRSVGNTLGVGHIGGHGAAGTTSLTDRDGKHSTHQHGQGLTGSHQHGVNDREGLTGTNERGINDREGLTGTHERGVNDQDGLSAAHGCNQALNQPGV